MATSAISAFGTLLKIGDGATSEAFTTIAEVRDISGPGFELGTTEVTAHDSDGWREFVATLLDGGEISFDINFGPAEATHDYDGGLLQDMVNKTRRNFQLIFPDTATTTWTLPAYVTNFEPGAPVDGELSASVTLKVTGQPTLA